MKDLLNKRAEIFNEMKTLNNTIVTRAAKGEAYGEEQSRYDALDTEFASLTSLLDKQDKFRNVSSVMNRNVDDRIIETHGDVTEEVYRAAFVNYLRTGDATELRATHNTFSVAEGAALVGQTLYNELTTSIRGDNVVRALPGVDIITTRNLTKIPIPSTSLAANVLAQGPSGSYNEVTTTFAELSLDAYKLGNIVKVSEELLNDTEFNLNAWLTAEIAGAVAEKEEQLFMSGSGTAETLGLLRYTTGATNTTLLSGSVADGMIDAQFATSHLRKNGVYIIGPDFAKRARKVKTTDGQYLWTPSLVEGTPDRFNGRPVYISDAAPATAVGGTVGGVFVVPGEIVIGDRVPFSIQRLNERYAEQGFIGFKFNYRTDMVLRNAAKSLTRLVLG